MNTGFFLISSMMLVSGVLWLLGVKYLGADTAQVEKSSPPVTA
jgi:hypothetical protein